MQYIARQPILDTSGSVQAYELLFRESAENRYTEKDGNLASLKTMDTAMLVGLDGLADGHSLFLNCSRHTLVRGVTTQFPPDMTVLEVLESVEPDEEVISACRRLKKAGYRIALDDVTDDQRPAALVDLADFIKVDFRATPPARRASLVSRYRGKRRKLLAEKVETREEFAAAVKAGFVLFQGYYFCKPAMISTPKPPGMGMKHMWLLQALGQPRLDFVRLEQLIKSEPALCYRLFRFLNSPAFYLQSEIKSVLHGLVLLGEIEVRKWLLLVSVVMAGPAGKRELVVSSIVRARFAEALANAAGVQGSLAFILGLMSLMEAVLDMPLQRIIEQIVLPPEVRAALQGESGCLQELLKLVIAYEAGDWEECEGVRQTLDLTQKQVSKEYLEAVAWAKRLND